MIEENCSNCLFSHNDTFCRRYPRTTVVIGTNYPEYLFSKIHVNDWCGEWKPNKELQEQRHE